MSARLNAADSDRERHRNAGALCLRISVRASVSIYDAVADKHLSQLDYPDLRQPDTPERWAYRLMGWSYRTVGRSQLLSNTFFARPRSTCGPISFSYA